MTRDTFDAKAPPHLVSLAAEMSIRKSIRSVLRRRDTKFIALLKLPNDDDTFLYEEAARRLIGVGDEHDGFGNETTLVCTSSALDRSPWTIVSKLGQSRRVLVFHDVTKTVADDVRLSVDFESEVLPPSAKHFSVAARKLGLPPLSQSDAAFLASQPLRSVRLAMLRGRPYARVIASLTKSEQPTPNPLSPSKKESMQGDKGGPTLETLAGYGEARTWGLQLARDLAEWKNGAIDWEDVDRGALLHGPPGCGKTIYASALARSCGVPLLTASAAQWQAKGHLGDMLKAMRLFFENASKEAPCIAFLDEVDSFGDRDADTDDRNADYQRQVINALLECLAPADGRRGVVVVGATNNAKNIDAALLRPGRFEKVIDIPMPDNEARLSIFRHHLSGSAVAFDEKAFCSATRGWSGAQLEKLARDARRLRRRRGGEAVSDADISGAMPPYRAFTRQERFRLAIHEAGHALLVLALQPANLLGVRIAVGLQENSRTIDLGTTAMKEAMPIFGTQADLTDRIIIMLGGMVAEKMILGEHSTTVGGDRTSDLATVTRYATMMERHFGFGDNLMSEAKDGDDDLYRYRMDDRKLSVAVNKRLETSLRRAQALLQENREGLFRLARHLVEEPELGVETIRKIVGAVVRDGAEPGCRSETYLGTGGE
ncbi:ATP-dependent zinc metalloprotease FtsH [Neorhizobium galegae bv. orientalis]|nr:ATP-dependent zinc metalloprotease FtsH [Neorhizobium galegae bv. orientalis]